MLKMENNNQTEKCISCGKDTGISINTHIDVRKGYVEGAGQLCAECFIKTYNEVQKKDVNDNTES